ncbi:TonB-dependent receptor plug domain-containing protein [Spirosoma rhododendri]|uniref:TonB-dependent receptor plug domain-containing protein n=1 Tax=Spirosoma rhododendri TaxID=2728024 RepID=UPI0020C49B71|nr:TonB-dependent receptor plug domain-containing protein [Spirosoma rhododendri]
MKRYVLLLIGWLTLTAVHAQLILGGTVTDEQQQPLGGVKLSIQGTSASTVSLPNGTFSLPTDHSLPLLLLISRTGYRDERIKVRSGNFRAVDVQLRAEVAVPETVLTADSKATDEQPLEGVTVEKIQTRHLASSPALSPFDALQNIKGVDLLTSSFLFKSVNMRGFGSTTNGRVVQLIDGMDNRSPGLGFGFGNVAGLPDLDVETIELRPGASSAQYGPDALQGLMLTTSKSPFEYQGLSVRATLGANNFGKPGFGPKTYADYGLRYALQLGDRLAVKVNFQRLTGTDFIADDYTDRSAATRPGFFAIDASRSGLATGLAFRPNNDPNTNFEYDGVNSYGDDLSNGGAFRFPASYANTSLQNKLVTRTGYTELDLLGNQGRVFNNRANASLHYRFGSNVEASIGWYFGNGNLIETAGFRNYLPNYRRNQFRAEIKGDNFFVRVYTTQQQAEGWNIGLTARAVNNSWKSLNQWAAEVGLAYVENKVSIGDARFTANRGRYLPGSTDFNRVRDAFANTANTDSIPGTPRALGLRFRDNSQLWHYEGMYTVSALADIVEVTVGASFRQYLLESGGTLFARQPNGAEYTINETGGYVQAAKTVALGPVTVRPLVAVRYDKNQYVTGGFTPGHQ